MLSDLLDGAGLEWLEADVRQCPKAMAHLATIKDLRFSAAVDLTINRNTIVLHADKISVELGDYLTRSRYEGWIEPGSPGAWANSFASSLEGCWKPSTAKAPWQTPKD